MSDYRKAFDSDSVPEKNIALRKAHDEIVFLRAQVEHEISKLIDIRAQIASARKALEGVYDHMDRNGMASWPVAKRVRKELDSLTDEKGDSK